MFGSAKETSISLMGTAQRFRENLLSPREGSWMHLKVHSNHSWRRGMLSALFLQHLMAMILAREL